MAVHCRFGVVATSDGHGVRPRGAALRLRVPDHDHLARGVLHGAGLRRLRLHHRPLLHRLLPRDVRVVPILDELHVQQQDRRHGEWAGGRVGKPGWWRHAAHHAPNLRLDPRQVPTRINFLQQNFMPNSSTTLKNFSS